MDDLSDFMGAPNSENQSLLVEPLDISGCIDQLNEDASIDEQALKIWNSGEAFVFITNSCSQFHAGDRRVIRIMILSFASTLCLNSYGMNLDVTGEAGTGKSHCASTVAGHIPDKKVIRGRMSDKAIFHHLFDSGCVFIIDDQGLSEDFEEAVKEATTDFHEPTPYRSVKNGAAVIHYIPAESLFWFVKAESVGDEQTQDRVFNLHTDDSEEQLDAIKMSIFDRVKDPASVADTTSKRISRKIWEYVPRAYVTIPYTDYIVNEERPDARNINLFLDLILTSALIHAPLRRRGEDINGNPNYIATVHDFNIASRLMNPLLNNIGGSQKNKIDPNSQKILDWLEDNYPDIVYDPIPFSTIRDALNINQKAMSRIINGRNDLAGSCSIEEQCPAIEVVRMNNRNVNGAGTHSGKGIKWNPVKYREWVGRGGMFALDTPDEWRDPDYDGEVPDWYLDRPSAIELREIEEIKKDDAEELARIDREKLKTRRIMK